MGHGDRVPDVKNEWTLRHNFVEPVWRVVMTLWVFLQDHL